MPLVYNHHPSVRDTGEETVAFGAAVVPCHSPPLYQTIKEALSPHSCYMTVLQPGCFSPLSLSLLWNRSFSLKVSLLFNQ